MTLLIANRLRRIAMKLALRAMVKRPGKAHRKHRQQPPF
jgi:hypothetical protein